MLRSLKERGKFLLVFLTALWGLELIDTLLLGQRLNHLGIRPRSLSGLWGIVFAPLLHGNLLHLLTNTLPFLVLGFLLMLRGQLEFLRVTVLIWLIGGLGIWLTGGPNTIHLGLSMVVFGYLGYLLSSAYYQRNLNNVLIALLVGFLYGGMIFGVLPLRFGVSWQGHLFGFVAGVLAAGWLSQSKNHPKTS
jgi:membrane associated rhomboid family serine protease